MELGIWNSRGIIDVKIGTLIDHSYRYPRECID